MTRDKFPDSAVVFGSDAEVKARQLFEQEIESQRLNAENAAKLLNQRESLRLAEQDIEERAAAEKAARLKARKDRLRAVSSGNF